MENDDLLNDDFLRNLVRNTKLEEPSGDFVGNVMTRIQPGVEMAPAKKPFYLFLKSAWLYVALAAALVVFLLTSDIPVMDFFPGKQYFTQTLFPYFDNVFSGFKNLFEHSKFTNIGLMVIAAGGLLYILDLLFSRRAHTQHHYTS
jgi:hypothetical protein